MGGGGSTLLLFCTDISLRRRCGRRREHATAGADRYFHGDQLTGVVTGLLAMVTTLSVMVTHSSALRRRRGRLQEHATVSSAHLCFHGKPLAGMVTGLLAAVTILSVKLTHSSALRRRCGRRREHNTVGVH